MNFSMVARMEWLKLRSVRSAGWLLAAAVGAMVATGTGVGLGYRGHRPLATAAQIVDNSLGGAVLAQLLIGALGVLLVTGEYSSGLIHTTLAAVPRRSTVLAAKAVVAGAASLAAGLFASLAGFVAGQAALLGSPVPAASWTDPEVVGAVLRTGVYLGVVGLIGVGLGAIIRHGGGAIGALFAGLFVPALLVGMFGTGAIAVGRFVPVLMLLNSMSVTTPVPGMLPGWAASAVMVGYAAVAIGLACVLLARRDA